MQAGHALLVLAHSVCALCSWGGESESDASLAPLPAPFLSDSACRGPSGDPPRQQEESSLVLSFAVGPLQVRVDDMGSSSSHRWPFPQGPEPTHTTSSTEQQTELTQGRCVRVSSLLFSLLPLCSCSAFVLSSSLHAFATISLYAFFLL